MIERFRFASTWKVAAPPDAVFDAVADTVDWPNWWPHVVEVVPLQDASREPRSERIVVRAPAGYRLSVVVSYVILERPLRVLAVLDGDLRGEARARFVPAPGGGTAFHHELDARPGRWWMRLPGLAWFLERNHDRALATAVDALSRKLNADVRPAPTTFWEG